MLVVGSVVVFPDSHPSTRFPAEKTRLVVSTVLHIVHSSRWFYPSYHSRNRRSLSVWRIVASCVRGQDSSSTEPGLLLGVSLQPVRSLFVLQLLAASELLAAVVAAVVDEVVASVAVVVVVVQVVPWADIVVSVAGTGSGSRCFRPADVAGCCSTFRMTV